MDYHFAHSDEVANSSPRFNKHKLLKSFLPVFVLSALMPALLMIAMERNKLNFSSQANQNQLRIWLEPQSALVNTNEEITFSVMAVNESSNKLVHNLHVPIQGGEFYTVTPNILSHVQPFTGRIQLGTIKAIFSEEGNYEIAIPPAEIKLNTDEIQIFVSSANVEVNNSP